MSSHPLLYEINTRCWLAELAEKAGRPVTLADVPDSEFEFWRRCGFTHLWLMGVWATGARGLAHSQREFSGREEELRCCEIAGSPYAITGYCVSANLGGEKGLAKFRHKLNACGIKLLLDFIPNHTALDHPWVRAHPEFYVTTDLPHARATRIENDSTKWFAHGHCGFGPPWVDTLQLDYRNPALRRAMIDELRSISARCDGVRCDMAMLELNDVFARTWPEFPNNHSPAETEFWIAAIEAVREQRKDFLFLAEVYWDLEPRLQELGFDYTYDKRLYDRIVGRKDGEVTSYLYSLSPGFMARSAHFIENHDEPRVASLLPMAEHRAAALLILCLPGMRLLHEGQLRGARIHAHVHFARRGEESEDDLIAKFYDQLLSTLSKFPVGRGEWKLLTPLSASPGNPTHHHFVLVQWHLWPDQFDLAVINFSNVRSQCFAPLDIPSLGENNWRLTDLLGEEIHERTGADLVQWGLYFDAPPYAAQLFHCEPTD